MAGDDVNMEEGREYDVASDVGRALCSEPVGDPRAVAIALKQAPARETHKVTA